MDSHAPPVVVVAAAVKLKLAAVLFTVINCDSGRSWPKVVLKLRAGMGSSFCAQSLDGAANASSVRQSRSQGCVILCRVENDEQVLGIWRLWLGAKVDDMLVVLSPEVCRGERLGLC